MGGRKLDFAPEDVVVNVSNHPNWGNPSTNISSVNTVGVIGGINGTMRQAQFALEYQF